MRITLTQGLLKNLRGEIPSYMRREFLSKEVAYEKLKRLTGQDFGMDPHRWEEWINAQEAAGKVFHVSGTIGETD